jgi:hypothetical protein
LTFNNISAISWRPVLVVEEAGVPGEDHRSWASNHLPIALLLDSKIKKKRAENPNTPICDMYW